MKIQSCRTNHKYNPIGFQMKSPGNPDGNPYLSWEVINASASCADSVRILVSTKPDFTIIAYDSGFLKNYTKNNIRIPLKPAPYTRYYWKVAVHTDQDGTAESNVHFFETGKGSDSWHAHWIGCPEIESENPIFSQTIVSDCQKNVRFYLCGLGIYELYVNGRRCGEEFFAPGCSEYDQWLQYQTYEFTLKKGANDIQISLGNGWYKGKFGLLGNSQIYGSEFAVIGELWGTDAHELLLQTDETWIVKPGSSIRNNFYDGEEILNRSENAPKYPATILHELDRLKTPLLTERLSVPVTMHETFRPVRIIQTPNHETVLDFGQNMAGVVRFDAEEPVGSTLRLQYGELLQNGCFYRDNLRSAKAEFIYHGTGQKEHVQPHFTYYGFRYVKIKGLTRKIEDYHFEACAIYSDLEQTGELLTGNSKVNQLISNISWGQKSNYVDIPTDCPQRDERLGWTADAQIFSGAACFLRNSYPFLEKFCKDLYATQCKWGYITNTIPAFDDTQPSCAGWADAAVLIPWTLYQFCGDIQILADQFESMKMWVDYTKKEVESSGSSSIWSPAFGYGDWLAFDHDDPNERMLGGTELAYISTAYYYYSTLLVAKTARILNSQEDYIRYTKRAEQIKQDFLTEYFTPTGRLAVNTQTAYVLSLYMGLYPNGSEQRIAKDLHEKLENCKGYLKTGFIGTAYIMKVLSRYGYHEDACQLLLNEDIPSWLYAVNLGATTLWERWDSLLPDGNVNGTDMNSFNHYAYGAVADWMFQYLAGFQLVEDAPGFTRIQCKPYPCRALKELHCTYTSAAGTYEIEWKFLPRKKFKLKLKIPFGASAHLILPYSEEEYHLSSGEYTYIYTRKNDGTEYINTDMPFSSLRKIEEIKPILEELFAGYKDIPDTFGKESLRALSKLPYFQIDEEILDQIDKRIAEIFEN